MSVLVPVATLDQPGVSALPWLADRLTAEGFRFVQTFDLQVAREHHSDCTCPHHGTDKCDCQMIVLLVYGREPAPITLIVHSHDGRTWLSMAADAEESGTRQFESVIRRSLSQQPVSTGPVLPVDNENRAVG